MKHIFILLTALFFSAAIQAQPQWKKEQIMPTKDLADKINTNGKDLPLVINVGTMENIKTAVKTGPANSLMGIDKLHSAVAEVKKDREIVIYCGCCTLDNCSNVNPAYKELVEMGYKKVKVLELTEGIRPDWIAKDYPLE